MEDKEPYSEAEQEYLNISGTDGTAMHQDRTYEIDTNPIDTNPLKERSPKPEAIDIRELPQTGGKI